MTKQVFTAFAVFGMALVLNTAALALRGSSRRCDPRLISGMASPC